MRLGCPPNGARLAFSNTRFNEAEANAPRMLRFMQRLKNWEHKLQ